ncbi:MAG: hypothetical protein ACLFVG_03105 [Candidatus Aminicenantes bacterium]
MAVDYSVPALRSLEEFFYGQKIIRPLRIRRYDPGAELSYQIKGVFPAKTGKVKLEVEKFVGGGYAGQVYRVKIKDMETPQGPIEGLEKGNHYALKILVPSAGFARWFRNLIYAVSFQGPFSLQVNPAAHRAGALWQKLIRRGARVRLGSEKAVVDVYATFIDPILGSCGEISEWIEGRMWRFEVDDNLEARWRWKVGQSEEGLGSPEYRAKQAFMSHLVKLMHEMGAFELARQFEWWTCKSQPNVLKRCASDPHPDEGLVAVDFRAGLALLPFLPMCPADFKLIVQGIARGSWVQFDRGDLDRLQNFVRQHPEAFAGMDHAVEELKEAEDSYRGSLPDVAHHHLRLLYSRELWKNILTASIRSWEIRHFIDRKTSQKLPENKILTLIFWLLGLIPFLGNFIRKLWGRADFRQHQKLLFSQFDYFLRAGRARMAEVGIRWHRSGRVDEKRAQELPRHPWRCLAHLPLSLLPPQVHRFFSDRRFFLKCLDNIFLRPLRLYFKAEVREKWLRQIISQGKKRGMLTAQEAAHILAQIKEPFIQKYLKSLAVHICTAPVTQIVSVLVAVIYVRLHPELSFQEASLHAGLILGFFQVTPISPGSIVRGLYVTALVMKERNFKDYHIAFYLSFFKYIGYLAFPIQMAYRYLELARFMAGHWATGVVHIVPVFGERGALLEHAVFDFFYNYPLSLRRRIRHLNARRSLLKPRYWQVPVCAVAGTGLLAFIDYAFFRLNGHIPGFGHIWWISLWVPFIMGAVAAAWARGALFSKRMIMGAVCGTLIGLVYAGVNAAAESFSGQGSELVFWSQFINSFGVAAIWRMFLFTLVAFVGAFIAEARPRKTPVVVSG